MVYIVTNGRYSDYGILAAFTDEQEAIVFCIDKWLSGDVDLHDNCEIEVWEGADNVRSARLEDVIKNNKANWIGKLPERLKERVEGNL